MVRTTWMALTGAAVLWMGLTGTGCGGSATSGSGGGTTTGTGGGATTGTGGSTPESACDDFSAAVCDKLGACAPLLLDIQFGDVATCSKRDAIACNGFFNLPGVSATPAEFSACAAAYMALSCDDLLNGKLPEPCQAISNGTLADGQPCSDDLQCTSGSCHQTQPGDLCGVCAHVGAAGDTCDPDLGDDCAKPLFCAPTTKKCTAISATKGDACSDDVHCFSPFYCASGVCAVHVAEGGACDSQQNDCDVLAGFFCSPKTKICAKIALAGPGEACGFDAMTGMLTSCKSQGQCNTDMSGKGVCAAPLADGAACVADPTEPETCTAPAHCLNSVCSLGAPMCQ